MICTGSSWGSVQVYRGNLSLYQNSDPWCVIVLGVRLFSWVTSIFDPPNCSTEVWHVGKFSACGISLWIVLMCAERGLTVPRARIAQTDRQPKVQLSQNGLQVLSSLWWWHVRARFTGQMGGDLRQLVRSNCLGFRTFESLFWDFLECMEPNTSGCWY